MRLSGGASPFAFPPVSLRIGAVDLGLQDKVAMVAGASRGIGKAVALTLAAEGCHVTLGPRRPMISPGAASNERSRTATRGPNDFVTPSTLRTASASAATAAHLLLCFPALLWDSLLRSNVRVEEVHEAAMNPRLATKFL